MTQIGFGQQLAVKQYSPAGRPLLIPTAAGEGRWMGGPILNGQGLLPSAVRVQPEGGMLIQFTPSPGLAVKFWQIGMLCDVATETSSLIELRAAESIIGKETR